MQIIELHTMYIYDGIAGRKEFFKDSRLVANTNMHIENILSKVRNNKKFFELMITRLKKLRKIDKVICSIICLYKKGFCDIANYYESIVLLEQLKEISRFKD